MSLAPRIDKIQRNILLNGNFELWQRGTTVTAVGNCLADRWYSAISGPTATNDRVLDSPVSTARYSNRLTATSTTTAAAFVLGQRLEVTTDRTSINGKTLSLSFWYKSNKVSASHVIRVTNCISGTGGINSTTTFSVNVANTWEYKTLTFTVPAGTLRSDGDANLSVAVDIGMFRNSLGISAITSGDYFQIAQVMLVEGSLPLEFQLAGNSQIHELALCQRYYEKSYSIDVNPATSTFVGIHSAAYVNLGITNNAAMANIRFVVAKRAAPTMTIYSIIGTAGRVSNDNNSSDFAAGSGSVTNQGTSGFQVYNASGGTITPSGAGFCVSFHYVADAEL